MILQFLTLNPGKNVLLVAPSNTMVDDSCQRLEAKGLTDTMMKISAGYIKEERQYSYDMLLRHAIVANQMQCLEASYANIFVLNLSHEMEVDHVRQIKLEIERIENRIFNERRIVLSTCAMVNSGILKDRSFDFVIVDEAGRTSDVDVLKSMYKVAAGGKLVLVGDPCQGRPCTSIKHDRLSSSLLEKLTLSRRKEDPECANLLNTQYRAHSNIAGLYNNTFYADKLLNGVSDSNRKSVLTPPQANMNVMFFDVKGEQTRVGDSYANAPEANLVNHLVKLLLQHDDKMDIGIVTYYRAQVRKIRQLIGIGNNRVKVDTVDAFQGSENDVIIMSMGRSEGGGFTICPYRLCVAISRARKNIFIVGDFRNMSTMYILKDLLMSIQKHGHLRRATPTSDSGYTFEDFRIPTSASNFHCLFMGYDTTYRLGLQNLLRSSCGIENPEELITDWKGTTANIYFRTQEDAICFTRLNHTYQNGFERRLSIETKSHQAAKKRIVFEWNAYQTIVVFQVPTGSIENYKNSCMEFEGALDVAATKTERYATLKVHFKTNEHATQALHQINCKITTWDSKIKAIMFRE